MCRKCDKPYKARNSLWYHENKCAVKPTSTEKINEGLMNLICEQTKAMEKITSHNTELQKQSLELQKLNTELVSKTLELCKPVNNNNTTITQTNNNNQKFNINVFLNETCKDAINFSDFVKNIQISYEDLENSENLRFPEPLPSLVP
jgi:hypothetical protein